MSAYYEYNPVDSSCDFSGNATLNPNSESAVPSLSILLSHTSLAKCYDPFRAQHGPGRVNRRFVVSRIPTFWGRLHTDANFFRCGIYVRLRRRLSFGHEPLRFQLEQFGGRGEVRDRSPCPRVDRRRGGRVGCVHWRRGSTVATGMLLRGIGVGFAFRVSRVMWWPAYWTIIG
jgi:hypothetical protein